VRNEQGMRRLLMVAVAMVLAATVALTFGPGVEANGQGVTVYLGYLPEVSNWGSYEATGRAYVNAGEGRAQVTVDHMISDPAIRYEVWLVPAYDRDALFSLGAFEVDGSGHAEVELVNPDLKPAEFRFMVISAEPADDDDPRPDARRTIAGVFPNAKARLPGEGTASLDGLWAQPPGDVAAGATASTQGTAPRSDGATGSSEETVRRSTAAAPASPPRLPVTGEVSRPTPFTLALAGAAGAACVSLMVVRVRRQRAVSRVAWRGGGR